MSGEEEGVYLDRGGGQWQCIHRYEEGDYGLEDIVERFGLGERLPDAAAGDAVIRLSGHEATQLKAMADAQSFDHEPGFIAMCLEIAQHVPRDAGAVMLRANF